MREIAALWGAALVIAACATPPEPLQPNPFSGPKPLPVPVPSTSEAHAPRPPAPAPVPTPPRPCPEDMEFVDAEYCGQVRRKCLKSTRNRPNNLTICHEFAQGTACVGEPRRQRFCIDRYEFPNQKGAHPPVHVSAYDAAGLCAEQGKRMCWESEWVAACEGPDRLPFPYGHARSGKMCNIDNPWRGPSLERAHSSNKQVADQELRKLDQSVPSGSMETCKSGYGVYDLTGNFDEWVLTERSRGRSKWAGLKGGAWGHVRNACRPITTSHVPQFIYYFISFRCCKDANGLEPVTDGPPEWSPPSPPEPRKHFNRGWTPK